MSHLYGATQWCVNRAVKLSGLAEGHWDRRRYGAPREKLQHFMVLYSHVSSDRIVILLTEAELQDNFQR